MKRPSIQSTVNTGFEASAGLVAALSRLGARVLSRVREWWRTVSISAQLVVLCLHRSNWQHPASREQLALQLNAATLTSMRGYVWVVLLAATVITRIVYVTAQSYGLSGYAIEMLVRVLVIELIPLSAALFVALRYSINRGSEVYKARSKGQFSHWRARGVDPIAVEVLPSAVAPFFAVLALALLSAVLTTALAYFLIYGISPHGWLPFTRGVGKVFSPAVSAIVVTKTVLFALAVALTPVATALQNLGRDTSRVGVALEVLVRMFALLLAIEVLSLAANYA